MSGHRKKQNHSVKGNLSKSRPITSLLDEMKDGQEHGSIVGCYVQVSDWVAEFRRGLKEIEDARGRPCVCYVANTIKPDQGISIERKDDLPFQELLRSVPKEQKDVDVLVVTPGGSGEQVAHFVNHLRSRFDTVEFLLPAEAMSAGTLWVLSGDKIWMTSSSYIGPIDPQVRSKDGQLQPAQSILHLLEVIREEGNKALSRGQPFYSTH